MMKRIAALLVLIGLIITPMAGSAQGILDPACAQAGDRGVVCEERKKPGNPFYGPDGILIRISKIMVYIIGIASVIMMIIGGMRYVLSHGDSNNINTARSTILYALVGIAVALSAQAIIAFVMRRL